ncbi:MAG: nuclear transport factor 2 family protein [Tahibacter sp.]
MSASDNEARIKHFYASFIALDGEAMQACYADNARFEDPVFTLQGRAQIGGMWRMLCEAVRTKGRDAWKLDVSDIAAGENEGRAHWEPHYRFSSTGRLVHNIVDAAFTFTDSGLIATHRDAFPFWRWTRQALGPAGVLLGWTPMIRNKVRDQAATNLAAFLRKTG